MHPLQGSELPSCAPKACDELTASEGASVRAPAGELRARGVCVCVHVWGCGCGYIVCMWVWVYCVFMSVCVHVCVCVGNGIYYGFISLLGEISTIGDVGDFWVQ